MRHVQSTALVDFAEIYDENVEMVTVATPPGHVVHGAVGTLLNEPDLQAQWIQGGESREVSLESGAGYRDNVREALQVLRADIELPVELLEELLGCESCGVRIRVLEGPMCPRFHVDRVPCRMLSTYAGPGTEWIASHEVDWSGFAAADPRPTLPGAGVRQLPRGVWSLLKGGAWDGVFEGVVHRSPSDTSRRLLVSIDPIFSD